MNKLYYRCLLPPIIDDFPSLCSKLRSGLNRALVTTEAGYRFFALPLHLPLVLTYLQVEAKIDNIFLCFGWYWILIRSFQFIRCL